MNACEVKSARLVWKEHEWKYFQFKIECLGFSFKIDDTVKDGDRQG